MWDVTHPCAWHDAFIRALRASSLPPNLCLVAIPSRWLVHMCLLTHSYVWYNSSICVTWRIHMFYTTHSHVWHASFICVYDSLICVSWRIHLWNVTHPYAWHEAFIRAQRASSSPPGLCESAICPDDSFIFVSWFIHMWDSWLIHMWDVTHSYAWHDASICVSWLIHICDMPYSYVCMTQSYVSRDSFICGIWLIHMRDMTHWIGRWEPRRNRRDGNKSTRWWLRASCETYECIMWRGSQPPSRRLQCVAVCCSVLQCVAVYCSCSVLAESLVTRLSPPELYLVAICPDDLFTCVSCVLQCVAVCCSVLQLQLLIHMCFMTYSYLGCDSSICVTWRIYLFCMTHSLSRWLIHMCVMTHSYGGCDSSIWVTWRIHLGVDSLSCVWWSLSEDSRIYMYIYICIYISIYIYIYIYILCDIYKIYMQSLCICRRLACVTWINRVFAFVNLLNTSCLCMCDFAEYIMSSHVWICMCDMDKSCLTYEWSSPPGHVWDMTHSYVRHDSYMSPQEILPS